MQKYSKERIGTIPTGKKELQELSLVNYKVNSSGSDLEKPHLKSRHIKLKQREIALPVAGYILISGEPEGTDIYAAKSPFSTQPKKK
jgi:hypothetical protein